MLLHTLFLQLALLALSVTAFFPLVPPDVCAEQEYCVEVDERSEIEGADKASDLFTLKIRQHVPKTDEPHSARVARYADRLARKYQSRNPNSKRANSYTVVTSTTPTLANSAAINQDGTDFSYFAIANFGSNGTPLYMLMDTGAVSTWVMGSTCQTTACQKHNTFGASDSKTYQQSSQTFSISYGTGTVSGYLATDSLSFAGLNLNLTFGAANQTSNDFLSFALDGILGLSQAHGATPPTFLQVLTESKALKSNIFGVNLNRAKDGTNDGEINFGGIDTTKFTGSLSYTSVSAKGSNWIIPLDSASFKGQDAGLKGKNVVVDTGTTFMFIPAADAKPLYALISGSQLSSDGQTYTVPCSTTDSIQFTFSGVSYTVPAQDWVGGTSSGSMCTSNIYPRDATGAGNWLFGDVFLKNVYTVFDVDQNRVGFGIKAAASSTSSSASANSAAAVSTSISTPSTSSRSTSPTSSRSLTSTTKASGSSSSNAVTTVPTTTTANTKNSSSITTSASSTTTTAAGSEGFNAAVTSQLSSPTSAAAVSGSTTAGAPAATTSQPNSSGRRNPTFVTIIVGILAVSAFLI